ncbi:hypothetical protein N431DRAFT_348227 [Stipitochalara longipes BDJ]|nr:hypothetical protein N431DRAFT_348227 [Stipitochalara longipes BDJ]
MDVKHVQAVQINHADRILRLEKRQADDAALKSVWGTGSPFPGVLSGTPQQGPVPNPSADVFDDFDDEQGQHLLNSLQLEADEEPVRRGASRANSVRFDVSAIQGSNWAAGSRNSGEFGPVRPGSGFGSHPMTERSLSHKSDGRHSSAGHSVHSMHSAPSGRTSSLGLDTNFLIGGQGDDSPLDIPDPPPGLFILGSVPSIIRCWLTTNFSHNSLLYADVCTGSQRSLLDFSLVKDLGLLDQVQKDTSGRHTIRLPVYLPEAIITQPTSRSNSPAPHLPTLSADFELIGLTHRSNFDRKKGIRVFLGSDTLRAHNADILFSQNLMTLYGDDRNKLSVPFVRPEDENLFKNLGTTNVPSERNELKATAPQFTPTESKPKVEPTPDAVKSALANRIDQSGKDQGTLSDQEQRSGPSTEPPSPFVTNFVSEVTSRNRASSVKSTEANGNTSESEKQRPVDSSAQESESLDSGASADSARRESSGGIWGSWRQANGAVGSENESTSGYQRATRGVRNMKVLKPSKTSSSSSTAPVTSRSSSAARTGAAYEPTPARSSGETRRKSQSQLSGVENAPLRWESKRVGSDEQKTPRTIATIPRSSNNPVGGASAFAWMNSSKPKATTAE